MQTESLNELLKEFYLVVGIRVSIFDGNFRLVTEYPEEAPRFCRNIRRTEAGREACAKCDAEACMRAKNLGEPHVYTCHAGLFEAITPILLDGGVSGYAILAHMMPEEGREACAARACDLAEKYGVSRPESEAAVAEIVPRSTAQMAASVKILDALASYLYTHHLVRWHNDGADRSIERYIRAHLSEKLTIDLLCEQFHCSRSYLSRLWRASYGMGIGQFITKCRIECAKKLLAEGKSIAETAEMSGFSDYNYFCKVFKKTTSMCPTAYRNR